MPKQDLPVPSPNPGSDPAVPGARSDPETWLDEDGDMLFRCAIAVLRDRHLAEDLVQEALLAALESVGSFRGGSSRRSWLVGILRRKILDHLRRARRAQDTESIDPAVDGLWDAHGRWKQPPRSWVPDPEALAEACEFWAVLEGCLDTLPARQREALVLVTLQEHESEACKVLEVAATNLWVLVHRGRVRLRA